MRLGPTSIFIAAAVLSPILVLGKPDFIISSIRLINDTPENTVRFLLNPVKPGHENDVPINSLPWYGEASLGPGESQWLPGCTIEGDLCRWAIHGRIPTEYSALDLPLFQYSSASSCMANFTASSPHFSVGCSLPPIDGH
ncbi:hypothetical protein L218DRAFT_491902 [Marasmius fiardii PR-910]|nr:hypothetical protein L218DRAFT_491902 [Marasmius fiardii PR-910]